jgi:O-antigen/teichoic acid export membrane protein
VEQTERPSLARSSTARLGALLSTLVFGFVTSVLTARWLGPSGKGTLSALSFLGDIFFFYICMLGLGEASIVMIGKKQVTVQRALSASLLPLLVTGLLGIAGLLVASIPAQWSGILGAVITQGVVLVLAMYMNLLHDLLNARERFGTTSLLSAARVLTTAVMTALILSLTALGIAGALLAAMCGVIVGLGGAVWVLKADGLSFRPTWDKEYLVLAAKLGIVIQAAYLLMAMSQRFDQLLVYSFLGTVDGGLYAVALSLGLLPGFVPVALSSASFPRLAHIPENEVWPLTAQIVRVGLIGGGVAAVVLGSAIPFFTPIVFGSGYARSVTPALMLMVAGLMWSVQWILARAWAARGRPYLLLWSFLFTVLTMLVLDLVLIPVWGLAGAAGASIAASAGGLAICLGAYRRNGGPFQASSLLPRSEDLRFLFAHGREMLRGA